MSKKNRMKSVIAMVMAGFVLCLSSCQKEEKRIIGKWKPEKVEVTELVTTNPMQTAILKPIIQEYMSSTYIELVREIEFTKDGKVFITASMGMGAGTYEVENGKLIMSSGTKVERVDITFPDKKTMQLKEDADENALDALSWLFLEEQGIEGVEITKLSTRTTYKKK